MCVLLSCLVVSDSLQLHGLVAHQAPLSMRFSRKEYWSGLPFPSPGDLPHPVVEAMSPALAGLSNQGSPETQHTFHFNVAIDFTMFTVPMTL